MRNFLTVFQPPFPQNRNKCSNKCFTVGTQSMLSYLCAFVSWRLCEASLWDCVTHFSFRLSLCSQCLCGEKSFASIAASRTSRRSGGSLPYTRRSFANSVALRVSAAAQTATKFSPRRRFSCFPPHILAHLGDNFANSANTFDKGFLSFTLYFALCTLNSFALANTNPAAVGRLFDHHMHREGIA
jgi:hypothetical protein